MEKLVNDQKPTIRGVKDIQDIGESNVLFVSLSAKKQLARVLAAVQGQSVLTIGEDGAFTQNGEIIITSQSNDGFKGKGSFKPLCNQANASPNTP